MTHSCGIPGRPRDAWVDDARARIAATLGAGLAVKLDDIIRTALESRLGPEFDVASLRGRLSRLEPRLGDPFTTYCLDGKPILQTLPGDDEIDWQSPSSFITVGLKYRFVPLDAQVVHRGS